MTISKNFDRFRIVFDGKKPEILVQTDVAYSLHVRTVADAMGYATSHVPTLQDEVNFHRSINELINAHFNNKMYLKVSGTSEFAKQCGKDTLVPIRFDVNRQAGNEVRIHLLITVHDYYADPGYRARTRTWANEDGYCEMHLTYFSINEHFYNPGGEISWDTTWDRNPSLREFPGHVWDGKEFHYGRVPDIPEFEFTVQIGAVHEFYHLFLSNKDEYNANSPYFEDVQSLANSGMVLHSRHFTELMFPIGSVDMNTNFQMVSKF